MPSFLSDTLRSKIPWMAPAVLAVMAWGAVASGSFQYDDFANILQDPATHHWDELTHRLAAGIRPLTRLSYALSDELFGEWAGGWLLINLLLHLFTALGVAKLVQKRTLNATAALLAGACFALQPANAEVIAYVSGRSTGLAGALIVAALLMHERSIDTQERTRRIVCATLLFLCACAAKEIALVFPVMVLLWERTRACTTSWNASLKRAAPYAVASFVAAAAMMLFSPRYRELLSFSLSLRSPLESLVHNLIALPMSVSLWFRPWALSVEHQVPDSTWAVFLGASVVSLALLIAFRERSRKPFVTLALLWTLIAMLPTHSIIAKLDAVTEGPLYLAWIGPSIALGDWFAQRRSERWNYLRWVAIPIGMVAIVLCQWRVFVWSDSVSLWQEAILRSPNSARAWSNLGVAQLAHGQEDSARTSLHTALHLDPNNMHARLNLDIVAVLDAPSRSKQEL